MSKYNGSNKKNSMFETIGQFIGRSRYIVIVACVAVMLLSISLFMLGTIAAGQLIVKEWTELFTTGKSGDTQAVVETLSIIGVMLRAVVFYLIGVGLYSLFISPLNLTVALGVESLTDLESKVVSVVVVILAVKFLQQFVQWNQPVETMYYGITMSLVVASLVFFQYNGQRGKEFAKVHTPTASADAQKEMFEQDKETREIKVDKDSGDG